MRGRLEESQTPAARRFANLLPRALGHWLLFFHAVAVALVPPIEHGACDKYRRERADCYAEHKDEGKVHDNAGSKQEERGGRQESADTGENRSRHRLVDREIDDFPQRHRRFEF